MRTISCRHSVEIRGLPRLGRRRYAAHLRRTRARCQPSTVSGWTSSAAHADCGRRSRSAASSIRSPDVLHSLDLALEDLNLAPEYQHLSLEPSMITVIGRNHV